MAQNRFPQRQSKPEGRKSRDKATSDPMQLGRKAAGPGSFLPCQEMPPMQREGQGRGACSSPQAKGTLHLGKTMGGSWLSSGSGALCALGSPSCHMVGKAPRAAAVHIPWGQGTCQALQSARLLIQTRLPRQPELDLSPPSQSSSPGSHSSSWADQQSCHHHRIMFELLRLQNSDFSHFTQEQCSECYY